MHGVLPLPYYGAVTRNRSEQVYTQVGGKNLTIALDHTGGKRDTILMLIGGVWKPESPLVQGERMALPKMMDDLFIGQTYNGMFGELGESPLYGVFYLPRSAEGKATAKWKCFRIVRPESPETGANDAMLADDECHIAHVHHLRWMVCVKITYFLKLDFSDKPLIVWDVEDITRYDTDSISNLCPLLKNQRPHLEECIRESVVDFLNTNLQSDEQPAPVETHDIGGEG